MCMKKKKKTEKASLWTNARDNQKKKLEHFIWKWEEANLRSTLKIDIHNVDGVH